jgi:small-conductance mechanosensitive channel/CRP-like cAMP-binding protein
MDSILFHVDAIGLAVLLSAAIIAAISLASNLLSRRARWFAPLATSISLFGWFVGLKVLVARISAHLPPSVNATLLVLAYAVLTLAILRIVLFVYGDLIIVRVRRGSFPAALKNAITVLVVIASVLLLLRGIMNINISSVIAATTVLTATLGLALQNTLANMLAGLTIHLEKPLRQGDWVAIGPHEGRVLDVLHGSTKLLTIDGNELYIPNSKVLAEPVVNYSRPHPATIRVLRFGVGYDVPPNRVRDVSVGTIADIPSILRTPAPMVRIFKYDDSSIVYEIRYAIGDYSQHIEIDAQLTNLLWYRFNRLGIPNSFPIREVTLREVTDQTVREQERARTDSLLTLMRSVDILAPLSREELGQLVGSAGTETFAAGETPIRQGDAGDSFYIIKDGTVDVVVESTPGQSAVVATLRPGQFFGEMSLLTGAPRTSNIHVRTDAEFLVIDKESFGRILVQNPSIAQTLSQILAERQLGLDAELQRLGGQARDERRANLAKQVLLKIRTFFGLTAAT